MKARIGATSPARPAYSVAESMGKHALEVEIAFDPLEGRAVAGMAELAQ